MQAGEKFLNKSALPIVKMANAKLYHSEVTGLYKCLRHWDSGEGSLLVAANSIPGLVDAIKRSQSSFLDPCDPAAGDPKLDFGAEPPKSLMPMPQNEVDRVVEALKGN